MGRSRCERCIRSLPVLTGKQCCAKLSPSEELLDQLRAKFSDVEDDFCRATGYGFDRLTESKACNLVKFKPSDTVRDGIIAEGDARGGGMGEAGTGEAGLNAFSLGNAKLADLMAKTMPRLEQRFDSPRLCDSGGSDGFEN